MAERLDRVLQSHGPQGIAFYLSGQMTTESQYVFNKFAKGVLRTNHVDSNSRLCMSSAAAGMTLSLGSDGPPTCYADIEAADTFLFVGSNAADAHPVTFGRVERRMERPTSRMVVIDPRRTATAKAADVHLAIRPGTDLTVLNGLMYLLDVWGKTDRRFIAAHTEGWDAVRELSSDYPPGRVAEACGITVTDLVNAAHLIGDARRLLTFWTMGVSQTIAGTAAANALINLHLALGQIGKPGCGPFSLTGQPNAMGGRSVGYMAHQLPGQRRIADADHRRQMERLWGLPAGTIYPHAGYDAVRLFDALESGDVRALWVVGTNPAASMPNLPKVRRALERGRPGRRAGRLPPDRDGRLRPRAAAGGGQPGTGRHVLQQRAAGDAHAARRQAARRRPARLVVAPAAWPPPWASPAASRSTPPPTSSPSSPPPPPAGPTTRAACPTSCWPATAPSSGPTPPAAPATPGGTPTTSSPRPPAGPASSPAPRATPTRRRRPSSRSC